MFLRQIVFGRLSPRGWRDLAVVVLVTVAAFTLGALGAVHPQVSRQQAIQAALQSGGRGPYPRIEAKYMHYSDFLRGDHDFGVSFEGPDYFVWVVAVSGRYGISPSGPCCYVPPPTTWGIAVVKDEPRSPHASMFESGVKGDWPPFFDRLPDLAN